MLGYNYAAHNWWPVLPHVGNCSGTPTAGIVGAGIIMSYLLLFVDFFRQTYIKNAQAKRTSGIHNTASNHKRTKSSGTPSASLLFRVDSSKHPSRVEWHVLMTPPGAAT